MCRALVIICISVLSLGIDIVRAKPRISSDGIILHRTAMSWEEADRICRQEGTILASPITDQVLDAMKKSIIRKSTMHFIGMKSNYYTGPFVTIEGMSLDNMSLPVMDMIDRIDQQDGDCLAMNSDSIRAVRCWSRLPSLCTTNVPVNLKCGNVEDGYRYDATGHKCYKVNLKKFSWEDAGWMCSTEGGHLAIIEDIIEARDIKNFLDDSKVSYAWVGLLTRDKSQWMSIHGQRLDDLHNMWFEGDTQAPSVPNKCGLVGNDTYLAWSNCEEPYSFICEREPTM